MNSVKFAIKICAVFLGAILLCGCNASKSVTATGNSGGGGVFTGFSINAW